ncbi:MAG: DUF4367 domain-containing protein [Lachnospiraceae bacterium]|nr:DUF4367 domain-containing protein [Lachnospiraceae bacterium]
MSKKQNQDEKEFLRSVKEQLYIETFEKDVSEYSPEKVETLVKMIELEEGSDEQELESAREAFEQRFRTLTAEKKKKKQHTTGRRIARAVAAMLAIVLVADITTYAFMDESLFHVLNLWTNQMAILPGESTEVELEDFQENETRIFTTVEEFAEEFGDDFLVCTWLPEGVELRRILSTEAENTASYMWKYGNKLSDDIISIAMYKKTENDLAGLTGTKIEEGKPIKIANELEAKVFIMEDNEYLVAFEYNGWWYLVYVGDSEEDVMKSILGGMENYEKINKK